MLENASSKVTEALLSALDDEDGGVRSDAALSLARVAPGSTAVELLRRLERSAEQDRGALGLALSGVLSRTTSDDVAVKVRAAVDGAPNVARDALIEGLGRMPSARAQKELESLVTGSADDRRKVAEALAGHAAAAPALQKLLRDPDPSVRAPAAWSLGKVGSPTAISVETALLKDPETTVAGNAAGALGRFVPRLGDAAAVAKALQKPLCDALRDNRAYVRANALGSLRLAHLSCDGIAALLVSDPADVVRGAAAAHLAQVSPDDPASKKALARCVADDSNAMVAEQCDVHRTRKLALAPGGKATPKHALTVFVVPDGKDDPVAGAPFTLVLPDGLFRMGIADRRGAVLETEIPDGTVELGVPAALAQ